MKINMVLRYDIASDTCLLFTNKGKGNELTDKDVLLI